VLGVALLEEGAPIDLRGTEFDLRDLLRARPELVETGFVPWARERLTERGPMDLYGEDASGRRVVVEVKRVRAGLAEATQLWRYVEKERAKRGVAVRGILVAPAISDRALQLLVEHDLEFRPLSVEALRQPDGSLESRAQPNLLSFTPDGRVA
jgi:endonuclease